MTKHLVLGSRGQVGTYLCDKITSQNHHELIEWDLTMGYDFNLADIMNYDRLVSEMLEVDFVHFLAFDVGGSKYLAKHQNSMSYIEGNVALMQNVFSALQYAEKPFYFASSQMQNMPESNYGLLKALGERYTSSLGGFNVRLWNAYGYERDPHKTHVITDFIRSALDTGRILCRTNGTERRNFTHAKDVATKLMHIATNSDEYMAKSPVPIFNNHENSISIRDVAKMVAFEIGDVEVYFSDKKDMSQTVYNDPYFDEGICQNLPPQKGLYVEFPMLHMGITDMVKRIEEGTDLKED